jgi:hypothetical protein
MSVHLISEESVVVTSTVFGAIHSGISILDQRLCVRTVFGEDADAKAASNTE